MSSVRDLHNQAMETVILAAKYADPDDSEANREYRVKAFELENQAALLALANENTTAMTWSVLCRSAAWTAIQAELFDEAEKIALTALARGAHPAEKAKLLDALFTAIKKQGYRLSSFEEEKEEYTGEAVVNAEERELVSV
ncbi:MAG: hypothetical protein FWC43_02525 [Planctomycetaceae bacterium]|nr:hypothetical protein [Planctomycetaceae bacterium]